MLKCVYHPLDPVRVVEDDEAERLMDTGGWFDCPKKARLYREKVEKELKQESKAPAIIPSPIRAPLKAVPLKEVAKGEPHTLKFKENKK